jgi:hypothetical protein
LLTIEALARLDLRPDEILAVTLGGLEASHADFGQIGEDITEWLAVHGQPVAGVMVLPEGSGLAAIRAQGSATVCLNAQGGWGDLTAGEVREALERAASIKHLGAGYGL